jgi:hypothetical protein
MFFLTWAASAVEIPVGADAHVSSIAPQVNAGTSPTLNLNGTSRIYLRFPLSGQILAGSAPAQIATAWLHLWPNRVDQSGSFQIVPTSAAWDESTITLANAPATASSPVATGIAVFAKSPVRVDVTILVQQALTNGNADLNLALVPLAGTAVYFDSKENTATSHMPVIEIEIAGPMTTGPKGPTGLIGVQGPAGAAGSDGFQLASGVASGGGTCTTGGDCDQVVSCINHELISGSCGGFDENMHLVFSGPVGLTTSSPGWHCHWAGPWNPLLGAPPIAVNCAK